MTDPISLDPLVYKDLKIALLQQRIVQYQAHERIKEADAAVAKAVAAAGLDPTHQYQLDDAVCAVRIMEPQ